MAWEDDKLGRQSFGRHVIDLLLSRYKTRRSFIANLDAPWGQGKTFFLENLAEQLRAEGYPVAYVNAWQDDRTDTPLIAVLGAIDDALSVSVDTSSEASQMLSSARKKLAPVVTEVGKQVGTHMLKWGLGVSVDKVLEALDQDDDYEADDDAISAGVDAVARLDAAELVADRLKSQKIEREAIQGFRQQTANALVQAGLNLPLFVIVDELDRCRPTYAVKMLEELKHIFSIEGVVFLIGTDTTQLAEAVKALYGSDFDSPKYLRRFFDRILVFPPAERSAFFDAVVDGTSIEWSKFQRADGISPREVFLNLFDGVEYSNRDIEQFVEILDTFVASWDENLLIEPVALCALIDEFVENPTSFPHGSELPRQPERRSQWSIRVRHNKHIDLNLRARNIVAQANNLLDYTGDWTAAEYFSEEWNRRVVGSHKNSPFPSLIKSYRERIILSARTASAADGEPA